MKPKRYLGAKCWAVGQVSTAPINHEKNPAPHRVQIRVNILGELLGIEGAETKPTPKLEKVTKPELV